MPGKLASHPSKIHGPLPAPWTRTSEDGRSSLTRATRLRDTVEQPGDRRVAAHEEELSTRVRRSAASTEVDRLRLMRLPPRRGGRRRGAPARPRAARAAPLSGE